MDLEKNNSELDDLELVVKQGSDQELKEFLRLLHPADIADLVEQVDEASRSRILSMLPPRVAADVISEIEDHVLEDVIETLPEDRLVDLVHEMDTDDAADLLAELPHRQQRQILAQVRSEDSEEIRRLMGYNPETAGGLMQTELIAALEDATVGEVIEEVRKRRDEVEYVHYVFVVDEDKRLKGVLDLRDLLLADNDIRIAGIMDRDVIKARVDMDQEEVGSLFMKYNLLSLPVVDDSGRLLGRIWVDDVMDVLEEEVDEDFLLMAGAGEDELENMSVPRSVKARLPWLGITWAGGITAAFLMGRFSEAVAENLIPLAAFIPIIMAMGGNVGSQSATIIVRGIATGRVEYRRLTWFLFRQVLIGALLGVALGAITGAYTTFRPASREYSLVIGSAMVLVITFAAFLGTFLPVFFKRIGVDPAVATAPIISMICDNVGIVIYLTMAALFL